VEGYCCTWSHSMTHTRTHTVELLWMRKRPVAQMSTWQNTALTRDRYPCPRRDSNPYSQQARDHRPMP
jgi:hypothetical protein